MDLPKKDYLTVFELSCRIKEKLEEGFPVVKVGGEVSNHYVSPAGHAYFTLKDERSQIRVVLFRGRDGKVRGKIEDGRFVIVSGSLAVYEKRGEYQVVASAVEVTGTGDLLLAFQLLKEKLQGEGLFDESRKRAIPHFASRVGIVTSMGGAAARDMVRIIRNRFQNTEIIISPTTVQGEGAAKEISEALKMIDGEGEVDVIIVGRGGGSIEDLWAFNEEVVVRTVASLTTPVISAVGHETDFTLCDFAADLRASTPSHASEMAVPVKTEELDRIRHNMARVYRKMSETVEIQRGRLHFTRGQLKDPRIMLRSERLHLAEMEERLAASSPMRYLDSFRLKTGDLITRMERRMRESITTMKTRLENLKGKTVSLNPRGILERGYSITFDARTKEILRDSTMVELGEEVETHLFRGKITSRVVGKE